MKIHKSVLVSLTHGQMIIHQRCLLSLNIKYWYLEKNLNVQNEINCGIVVQCIITQLYRITFKRALMACESACDTV